MGGIYELKFYRSNTPDEAIKAEPTLVIFSDGSREAYGAVAYCRWETKNGFESRLLLSKNRIAPLKVIDIVKLELCGALLSVRLRKFIEKEYVLKFRKVYHLIDSQIVKAMIGKGSYGYNTLAGNLIGEIHQLSSPDDWYWINGKDNGADVITRGCEPNKLGVGSVWQKGPEFLSRPEHEWPVNIETPDVKELPERRNCGFAGVTKIVQVEEEDTLEKGLIYEDSVGSSYLYGQLHEFSSYINDLGRMVWIKQELSLMI